MEHVTGFILVTIDVQNLDHSLSMNSRDPNGAQLELSLDSHPLSEKVVCPFACLSPRTPLPQSLRDALGRLEGIFCIRRDIIPILA